MARTIAIANQKGGVGKTTTSVNLAASLAIHQKAVLLLDLDPQSNTTSGVGIDSRSLPKSLYDCLLRGEPVKDIISQTTIPGLSIAPANSELAGAEVELVNLPDREQIFKSCLQSVLEHYDYVIVDCPPALGLLTINALVAVGSVLIPVQCEYYAMEGLGRLISNVKRIQDTLNPSLEIEGILLTMFDSRNSLARQVSEEIRNHFKEKVYKTMIPRNVTLAEAPSYGQTVLTYHPDSAGAVSYLRAAQEIAERGIKETREHHH